MIVQLNARIYNLAINSIQNNKIRFSLTIILFKI